MNTKDSPADITTRGVTITELKDNQLWWERPKWLSLNQNEWQPWENAYKEDYSICVETSVSRTVIKTDNMPKIPKSSFIININGFSYWRKLKRVTAYVLRILYVALWSKINDISRAKYIDIRTYSVIVNLEVPWKTKSSNPPKLCWSEEINYEIKVGYFFLLKLTLKTTLRAD